MNPIISIVTNDKKSSLLYYSQLYDIFKNNVLLNLHSIEDDNLFNLNGDVILVSTFSLLTKIRSIVTNPSKIIVADLSFKKSSLDLIKTLTNKKALFVNYNAEMTMNAIAQIYQYGIDDLELIPYYPGLTYNEEVLVAITPGESDIVPSNCTNIIDIGHRVLSLDTIIEIGIRLNQEDAINGDALIEYFKEILNKNIGFETVITDRQKNKTQLDILLRESNESIININSEGIILYINSNAKNLFSANNEISEGNNFFNFFSSFNKSRLAEINKPIHNINFLYYNKKYSISIFPLQFGNKHIEYLLIINEKNPTNIKDIQNTKKNIAYATFDDVLGNSSILKESISIAKKVSLTDFPVCIFGETGTGKGLLAESIHNYSFRRESPFISVNSGAIPDNLIESELFGYEEGAFTGAKRGGKPGFFELAENGTLFLDEIDSLNYGVQSKLLKVIENKEFRRIGGTKLLKSNVRIICSSNKNLLDLIKQKKFRDDLYYRINVLSIYIPPLRERKEDIPLIIDSIIKKNMLNIKISKESMNLLLSYDWRGNIRELQNVIYRLSILGKNCIEKSDINNTFIFENGKKKDSSFIENLDFDDMEKAVSEYYISNILKILKNTFYTSGIGRENIKEQLLDIDISISDKKLRNILKEMCNKKLIIINKGRAGTSITKEGISRISNI